MLGRVSLIIAVIAALLGACGPRPQLQPAKTEAHGSDASVSSVTGPGWLEHLGLTPSQTHMGQMGGSESVERNQRGHANRTFVLSGADLYLLSCRSCHGPKGSGFPPEINSLIGPVQAASYIMVQRRMNARGTEIGDDMAREMASEAKKSLLDRLKNGGKKMPAFAYLRGDEENALLAYLDQLAGVPVGKHAAQPVAESGARVGELMVRGTCHICHNATGPGGGHMGMMRGVIPSLASMPEERSLREMVQQVRNGSSGMMMMMGQRMPAFPYFTETEIEAAYLYLQDYPPQH